MEMILEYEGRDYITYQGEVQQMSGETRTRTQNYVVLFTKLLLPAHPDVYFEWCKGLADPMRWHLVLLSEVSSCPWLCQQPYLWAKDLDIRVNNFSKDESNDLVEEADVRCGAGEATSRTWRAQLCSCCLLWRARETLNAVSFPSECVQPPKESVTC